MRIEFSWRTWGMLVALGLAIYVGIAFLPLLGSVLVLLFLTSLLAMLIYPLARALEQRGIRRDITVPGVLILVALILLILVVQILPLITTVLGALANQIGQLTPNLGERFAEWVNAPALASIAQQFGQQLVDFLRNSAGLIGGLVGSLGAAFFFLFVLVVLVFTLIVNKQAALTLLKLVPEPLRDETVYLVERVSEGLARWFIAQSAISLYYIICYGAIGLVLGIPYAIPIAILSGLLEFIPYLGGIVGLTLSIIAASTVGPSTVIWLVVLESIVGAACVYFVAPYAFSRAIEIPAAAVLFGLFVGGQFGGFLAALLTVPVITVITILIREINTLRQRDAEQTSLPATEIVTPAAEALKR
jgi:predicted PurR-regulated permease PerM